MIDLNGIKSWLTKLFGDTNKSKTRYDLLNPVYRLRSHRSTLFIHIMDDEVSIYKTHGYDDLVAMCYEANGEDDDPKVLASQLDKLQSNECLTEQIGSGRSEIWIKLDPTYGGQL